jgi:hypothetical protein
MAIELSDSGARDTALRWARDQLSQVLTVTEALDEPLLAVHVCQALDATNSLLTKPARRP